LTNGARQSRQLNQRSICCRISHLLLPLQFSGNITLSDRHEVCVHSIGDLPSIRQSNGVVPAGRAIHLRHSSPVAQTQASFFGEPWYRPAYRVLLGPLGLLVIVILVNDFGIFDVVIVIIIRAIENAHHVDQTFFE
jgi:hypothetical protein